VPVVLTEKPNRRNGESEKRRSSRLTGSAVLAQWDKRYVWHPFTQQTEWAQRDPVIIASGKGVWLKDVRGRRFIDGVSSLWVNVFGHRKEELDAAIRRQLKKFAHGTFLGLTHEPAIRLAKKLIEIANAPHPLPPPRGGRVQGGGGLSRVFYSDNGSTAVEVALKMAYQYWQLSGRPTKTKFVSMKDGYHGDTMGSVSVGGIDLFHERFRGLLFKGYQVEPPHPLPPPRGGRVQGGGDIEQVLKRHHRSIAAVVLEPLIQGASGMRLMPRGYLAQVARLCKRYRVLLIVDEVATGFGRTGTMFACEQEGVSPDFLCVAKSLTGGYLPLAATLTTEKVYRAFLGRFDEFKAFFHGHTYTANPLACAVALANLELYRKENLLPQIRARSRELAVGLAPLKSHPHVKEIRQLGLMAGVELVKAKARCPPSLHPPPRGGRERVGVIPYPPEARMGLKVCDAALRNGVWLRPLGDVVVLMPPLAISRKELQILLRAVHAAIHEVTES
jgi:adenosylmethionine-8-amino-7-oxononanoate aminotransferase